MKILSKSFVIVASLALILLSCGLKREQVTAFTHVNLIPMTDERVIENQTVLVKGTRNVGTGDRY